MKHKTSHHIEQLHQVLLRILRTIDFICRKHDIKYWLEAGTLLGAVRHNGFIPWDDDIDIAMLRDDYNKFIDIFQNEKPDGLFLQTIHTDKNYINVSTPLKVRDTNSIALEPGDKIFSNFKNGISIDIFPYNRMNSTNVRKSKSYIAKKIRKIIRAKRSKNLNIFSNIIPEEILLYFHDLIVNKENINSSDINYGLDCYHKNPCYHLDKIFPLKEIEFEGYSFYAPNDTDYYLELKYGNYMKPPPDKEQKPKHIEFIKIDL